MTNQDVLTIYQNKSVLKDLKGFKLAKAVLLNMNKINDELLEVIRTMVKNMEESGKSQEEIKAEVDEILKKDSDIVFITLDEEDIPYDVSVEQLSILDNFIKK